MSSASERDAAVALNVLRIAESATVCAPGAGRPVGAFASALHVQGAYLVFDIRRQDPPFASVYDLDAASWWVEDLFGSEVAELLDPEAAPAASGVGASDGETTTRVHVDHSGIFPALRRLALGAWLDRYWPAGVPDVGELDVPLLQIELAALAWRLNGIFVSEQPAGPLLEPNARRLLELARDSIGTNDERVREIILDALTAGTEALPADTPALPAIADTLDRYLDDDPLTTWDLELETLFDEEFALSAQLEGAPNATAGSEHRGRAADAAPESSDSVDWQQVPPRVVDWDDGQVRFSLSRGADGTWTVPVRVKAAWGTEAVTDLLARVYSTAHGAPVLPLGVGSLQRDGAEYRGAVSLVGLRSDAVPDLDQLVVDVFTDARATRPALGPARADAAQQRQEVRAFLRNRVTSTDIDRFLGEPA